LSKHKTQLDDIFGFGEHATDSLKLKWSSEWSFFGNICYANEGLTMAQKAPHIDNGTISSTAGDDENSTQKEPMKLAMVHYLSPTWGDTGNFPNGPTGGTSFYRERVSTSGSFTPEHCREIQQRVLGDEQNSTTTTAASFIDYAATSVFCPGSPAYRCGTAEFPPPAHCYKKKVQTVRVSIDRKGAWTYQSKSDGDFELLLHVPYEFDTAVMYNAKTLHGAYIDEEARGKLTCEAKHGRVTGNIFMV
jgi:hypothetical protein